jgi:hypothetical protein
LATYREAYDNLRVTNDVQFLARMQEWIDILAKVRQKRGNGAMTDGRSHDHADKRRNLIELERLGQREFWKVHGDLTQTEMDEILYPDFVAEVRALGEAKRKVARRKLSAKMAGAGSTP